MYPNNKTQEFNLGKRKQCSQNNKQDCQGFYYKKKYIKKNNNSQHDDDVICISDSEEQDKNEDSIKEEYTENSCDLENLNDEQSYNIYQKILEKLNQQEIQLEDKYQIDKQKYQDIRQKLEEIKNHDQNKKQSEQLIQQLEDNKIFEQQQINEKIRYIISQLKINI
ncbi:hypothetical protein PPERSA_09377 [Pseudocohnilembus persalinus]|uniref:Uncharacterized protein n=1 Tax=Pseudocohnilembus persalinus TaxID=266149 RepID=A0A0V0QKY3_PSEPJ|nr:hypothetical protein PPERSA_09377 [Pseudocohnilembus persalinus]|eukprot:KRX02959.1 hypothetical protein PPERSA_09377 [Pseudocohnilembus persalinus]